MRIYVDSGDLNELNEWLAHPWVSGATTNPSLARLAGVDDAWTWAKKVVALTDKPVSIDGPPAVWELGPNVWRKSVTVTEGVVGRRENLTAVCCLPLVAHAAHEEGIISVFAGRIMDTGRDPQPVIDAAKQTGAQVLWASVREPYNIIQAEQAGCDVITVPPAILRKYLDWQGKPLEVVAEETI
jgi:transaldolase